MAAGKDAGAMREIYDRYAGYLAAVCSRYIPDDGDMKDILQDSFIKIYTSLDRFEYRGEGSLQAWMTRIVVNACLKSLRKRKGDPVPDNIPETSGDEEEDPGFKDIPMPVIMEMIRKLPQGYRTVFNLFVFEDRSHKEIASMLGIKENSSASQFFRARAILSKWITEYKKSHDNG